MDKPFNHLIICLTFVMPVAALSGCSGPNDSPEQDAVMSISSCTARGDDGQEMSVSEFGMFVTDTAGNLYPDNIRVLNRSGKWTFAEISLSDGDKGIYAYYPYNPSFSGGKMGLDARSQTDYLYSERTMVSGNAPSASITLYHLLSKVTFRMPAAVTAVRVADYSYSASYSLLTGSLEIKPEKGTISSGTGSLLLYPGDSPGHARGAGGRRTSIRLRHAGGGIPIRKGICLHFENRRKRGGDRGHHHHRLAARRQL